MISNTRSSPGQHGEFFLFLAILTNGVKIEMTDEMGGIMVDVLPKWSSGFYLSFSCFVFTIYGDQSKFGVALFLLVQVNILVQHLHCQAFCSFCSTPLGNDCGHVFFIVMTMVLAFGFAVIGSLLPASVISIYGAFMCYTALSSEPRGYACNGRRHSSAVSVSTSSWDGDDHSFSFVLCITCSISVTTVVIQGSRKEEFGFFI
ncbi:hypothetical protein ACLB2K_019742 [Fragaria x ananassa]